MSKLKKMTSTDVWASARFAGKHNYSFDWKSGGFNSCRANSRPEALRKARLMGASLDGKKLVVDEKSLRLDDDRKISRHNEMQSW